MDLSHQNRPGGVSPPINPFEPRSDTLKDDELKSDAGVSSTYTISSHGDTTDPRETLALQPHVAGSTGIGEGESVNEDREGRGGKDEKSEQDQSPAEEHGDPSNDKPRSDKHGTGTGTDNVGTKSEPKAMKEYSAEARTYHAYYDEVSPHDLHCSENLSLILPSSSVPTSAATTHGAATTAFSSSQNLASPCGHASKLYNCSQQCSSPQAQSSVCSKQITSSASSVLTPFRPSSFARTIGR